MSMFGNDRTQMRRYFSSAWKKAIQSQPLDPLEQTVADVVRLHPEYHALLEGDPDKMDRDYLPEDGESNPFLHMGMHISLHEQVSTNRPAGIAALYQQCVMRVGDPHEAEHQLMECLGRMLWEAQRENRMPDEQAYLECIRRLAGR